MAESEHRGTLAVLAASLQRIVAIVRIDLKQVLQINECPMHEQIVSVLHHLKPDFTLEDLRVACGRMVDKCELVNVAAFGSTPYSEGEKSMIANAIFDFIKREHHDDLILLQFDTFHEVVSESIEIFEFASKFSMELLLEYSAPNWVLNTPLHELESSIVEYWTAILFRYVYCVSTDLASMPCSDMMRFVRLLSEIKNLKTGATEIELVSHSVLLALESCD